MTKQTKGIDSDDLSINNGPRTNGSSFNGTSANGGESSALDGSANLNENIANLAESDAALLSAFEDASSEVVPVDTTDPDSKSAEADVETEAEATAAASFPEPLIFKGTAEPDAIEIVEAATPYPTTGSPPRENKSPPPLPTQNQAKVLEAATDSAMLKLQFYNQIKTLPWSPKVRLCELEAFLDQERKKFLGYGDLVNDLDTLVGLPYPIHESVKILKQHLYISLAEEQIKLEEKLAKYPLSSADIAAEGSKIRSTINCDQDQDDSDDCQDPAAEILYSSLLSNLPQYLVNASFDSLSSLEIARSDFRFAFFQDLFAQDPAHFGAADQAKVRFAANHVRSLSGGSAGLPLFNNQAGHRHEPTQRDLDKSHLRNTATHAQAF